LNIETKAKTKDVKGVSKRIERFVRVNPWNKKNVLLDQVYIEKEKRNNPYRLQVGDEVKTNIDVIIGISIIKSLIDNGKTQVSWHTYI